MIKLLLKHKLVEMAINTFFSKLSSNFIVNTKLNVGQIYTNIIDIQLHDFNNDLSYYEYTKYGRCKIKSITDNYIGIDYCDVLESYTINLKTNKKEYGLNRTHNVKYYSHIYLYKKGMIEVIP